MKNVLLVLSAEQKLKTNSSVSVSMVRNSKSHKFLNDELNVKAGSKHQCRGGAWCTEVLQNHLKLENSTFCNFFDCVSLLITCITVPVPGLSLSSDNTF